MLRRIRTWLRIVLPADEIALAVVGIALVLFAIGGIRSWLGIHKAWQTPIIWLTMIVWTAAILYATYRAVYFHPVENRPYAVWLADSLWRHPQPLPLGPLHLVWPDVVVVGLLTALFPAESITRLSVPTSFLLVYCLALTYSYWRVGIYWPAYANALLLGCFILVVPIAWARLGVAAAMYPVVYAAMQQLLDRFPFTKPERERLRLAPTTDDVTTTFGWPLPPVPRERWNWSISHADAVLVGATIGWLMFCLGFHFRELPEFRDGMERGLAWVVAASIIARVLIYTIGYAPPISLLGRLATGRLVIPGYDVVFAAPLAVAMVAWLLPEAAVGIAVPSLIAIPVTAAIAVWLSLALPPRRAVWHYTGQHRIAYRFRAAIYDRSNASKVRR